MPTPRIPDMSDPAKRAALKKRNLACFQHGLKPLYDMVCDYQPVTKVVFDENGRPDVVRGGARIFGGDIDATLDRQFEEAAANAKRLAFPLPNSANCARYAQPFLARILRRLDEEEIPLGRDVAGSESYFLYISGIGLGGHIDALVERTQCKAIGIVDSDPEFLFHSLEFYDWEKLFQTMEKRGGSTSILIKNDPILLARDLTNWLRNTNPMGAEGTTCFYHYENDVLNEARELFEKNQPFALTGLGFYYDESLMVRNTHHNLFSGKEKVYARSKNPKQNLPAFVIGTGPSLDKSMDFLRENQDKAILISSGTALRSLLVNGIVPDFQIETENIDVLVTVSEVAAKFDLKPITLVASTTVDTEIPELYKRVLYFFRQPLTPNPIFCDNDDRCLIDANITVMNGSAAFAMELGFDNIYFFGADLGVKEGGLHHSKDSYHYTPDPIVSVADLTFEIPMQGNFGGKAKTSNGFFIALKALERAIEKFPGQNFYNCSDGCRIVGAAPLAAENLALETLSQGAKAEAIEVIETLFPVYGRQEFDKHWDDAKIREDVKGWLDGLGAILKKYPDLNNRDYMGDLMAYLGAPGTTRNGLPVANLFRGTCYQILIIIEYMRRLEDPSLAPRLQTILLEEYAYTTGLMLDDAVMELGHLTAEEKGESQKQWRVHETPEFYGPGNAGPENPNDLAPGEEVFAPALMAYQRETNLKATEQTQPARQPLAYEKELEDNVSRIAAGALEAASSAGDLCTLIDSTAMFMAQMTADLAAQQPPPYPIACRAGCAFCCVRAEVHVAPLEAIRIGAYVSENFDDAAIDALTDNLTKAQERKQADEDKGNRHAVYPCPLLKDQRCGVYPVRPFVCHGFNSYDAGTCERKILGGGEVDIRGYAHPVLVAQSVIRGLGRGASEKGLESETLDLGPALLRVLAEPDIATTWLDGKKVFKDAHALEV
ncbi:MAG: DUF115 domain-containing protein [Rhodospirillales bacterium]|nr:DUF115 domain-containing protein [Rhodospirillales bacterium]